MATVIDAQAAASMIQENYKILCGGFLACGAAENIIDALVKQGTRNLELAVICTDYADRGVGKLIANRQVSWVQSSHIGTNTESQKQYKEGTLKVEFNPQGSLIERIRAAGAGLGGILTPTGVGTDLDKEREIVEVEGIKYFLETPIHGDVALVRAYKADKMGNLIYSKTARNSNPIMAQSAKITIAEVDEIVEVGELDPEHIVTPGVFVTHLVLHRQ